MAAARRLTLRVASHSSSSMTSTGIGPGHPGGVDEPAERAEGGLGLGHRRPRGRPSRPRRPPTSGRPHRSGPGRGRPSPRHRRRRRPRRPPAGPPRPGPARSARPMPEPPPVTSTPVPGAPRRSSRAPGPVTAPVTPGGPDSARGPGLRCGDGGCHGRSLSDPTACAAQVRRPQPGLHPGGDLRRAAGWPGRGPTAPGR